MNKKLTAMLMIMALILALTACGSKAPAELGWGTYENGTYENEFFEFSIDIPESYYYMTTQEIANMNAGTDEEGNPDPVNISTIDDLSDEILLHYVYATKYESDSAVEFNPYINIFTENMQNSSDLYNKEDYVENSMNYTAMLFESADIKVDVFPLEKPWISDRQFAKGTMKIDHAEFTMFQEIHAVTKNNYVLVIVIGYSNEAEKQELHNMIDSIKIK